MGVSTKPRSPFGEKLRTELDRQGLTIRGLAQRLDPKRPERARRNLTRWIAGTKPTKGSRVLVAAALGVDAAHFDEDDEEEDDELADIVHALLSRIDRRVEEEIARRLEVTA